jgi:hypothetical protein
MSKSNSLETAWLTLLFNNTNAGNIGDSTGLRGSSTAGSLYLSLHTADPGEAGDQTTNEVSYTGYARVAVARTSGGFTITNNQVVNAAQISFPQCTAGSATAAYWAIGTASSGAGVLLYSGPLTGGASPFNFGATASDDTARIPGHNYSVNDTIVFITTLGGALPTGISEGTIYYVKTVSGNSITISSTQGGATLDITGDGSGLVVKVSTLAISQNIQPIVSASQLVITED